uniref:Uncharacterized protein n=1 Tax=Oryza sativa subsp. japonica TaxID=39947 RepID=Q69JY7_ORYSJ|nr:hypothetical protein [Oryza sativa Japonica Group]
MEEAAEHMEVEDDRCHSRMMSCCVGVWDSSVCTRCRGRSMANVARQDRWRNEPTDVQLPFLLLLLLLLLLTMMMKTRGNDSYCMQMANGEECSIDQNDLIFFRQKQKEETERRRTIGAQPRQYTMLLLLLLLPCKAYKMIYTYIG